MINIMVVILCIGILSAAFGLLLVFAPNLVLRAERKANKLYMTDAVLIKNRIPLGFAMLAASVFLGYSYANNPLKEIIFLSFEQTKNKEIALFLNIDFWTTIVIYKDNKETYRSMGISKKSEIYSAIKSNT